MTEFTTILDRFRIPYDTSGRHKNRPGWVQFQCPFCQRDPYMGYSVSGRVVNCWNCGRHSLIETLQLLTHLQAKELYPLIGELPHENQPLREVKPKGVLKPPVGAGPLASVHRAYLRSRGFNSIRLEKLWNVGGVNFLGGHLAWRLYLPIYQNGEVVSWTTRRLDNTEPRYHDAKDDQSITPIKDTLYGIDYCRGAVVVVEGITDVWAVGPGAVALLGLRVSPAQLLALSAFPVCSVLFDTGPREAGARQRAKDLCNQLAPFGGVVNRITLETGKDAASADPKEIQELRDRYLK